MNVKMVNYFFWCSANPLRLSAFYITLVSGLKPLLSFRFNPGLKAGVNGDHLGWALALS